MTGGGRRHAEVNALATDLVALTQLDAATLRVEWRRLYGVQPPNKLSRDLLELGVAWKLQEQVLGGLSVTTSLRLAELAQALSSKAYPTRSRKVSLKPGARIIRSWGGETFEVVVIENGFLWRDTTWNSLSAIAREITGTRWSGPRFFGLGQTKSEPSNASRHSQAMAND